MMMNKTQSNGKLFGKARFIFSLVFLLFLTVSGVYAQEKETADEIFIQVEKHPEFPGGTKAMMTFLSENVKYPIEAQKNKIQGRVIVNFIIEKDGSLSNIQIVRGVEPSLDAEALRVIGSMPNWMPGEQRGEKVRVRYILPINFRLSAEESEKDTENVENKETAVSDEIFMSIDGAEQPEFPGGLEAMMSFLGQNIKYPVEAQKKKIQGRVVCTFVVMKDGSLDRFEIVRSVDPLLDAEAVRVIKSMPPWKPGLLNGEPVNVRFTLPVVFKL